MSKMNSFLFLALLMSVFAIFSVACGDDSDETPATGEGEGEGGGTDACANGSCDTATGNDTGTGAQDTGEALDPIQYEDDQYANPEAACEPQPENLELTAEITDDGDGAWVAQCENRFGVQGVWYSYNDNNDGGNSEITMDYSQAESGKICASGIGGMVYYDDYGKYWGAGCGLNVCMEGPEDARVENTLGDCTLFDSRTNIIGFRITIDGDNIPVTPGGNDPQLRVQFSEEGRSENAYIVVDGPGTRDYLFEDAAVFYALARGETDVPGTDPALVKALQFQVSTVAAEDTPFSFCVSDIIPILG